MNSLAGTPAQGQAPRTRLGGPITFRGQEYPNAAALEEALAHATLAAGAVYRVRLTLKGEALAAELAAGAGR